MEQPSTKVTRALIIFVIAVAIISNMSSSGFFEPRDHKGKGYYVKIPEGWKKVRQQKGVVYPEGVEVVMFVPKETNVKSKEPDAYISIFSKKLSTPVWIQDEFPEILASIARGGNKIMDKGEIKLDDVISEWLVYHDKKADALVLEFYMVTDNNMFYKMQYLAPPDQFNQMRRSFEELKDSLRFRFALY